RDTGPGPFRHGDPHDRIGERAVHGAGAGGHRSPPVLQPADEWRPVDARESRCIGRDRELRKLVANPRARPEPHWTLPFEAGFRDAEQEGRHRVEYAPGRTRARRVDSALPRSPHDRVRHLDWTFDARLPAERRRTAPGRASGLLAAGQAETPQARASLPVAR